MEKKSFSSNESFKNYNSQKNKNTYGSKADRWLCETKRSSSNCCGVSSHSEKLAEITTTPRNFVAVPATVLPPVKFPEVM